MQFLGGSVQLRVAPAGRATLGIGVAAVLAALAMTVWLLTGRPHAAAVAGPSVGGPAASPSAAASPSSRPVAASEVVVDVVGKVRHPGLYRLPTGARVQDAVLAAGGVLPGVALDAVNLAARLVDGQQIAIGVAGSAQAGAGALGPGAGSGTGPGPPSPLNLNTATLEQLETLPGVGPVLAQRVLAWRSAHGGFASVTQLDDVPGVGASKFAALKVLVTV